MAHTNIILSTIKTIAAFSTHRHFRSRINLSHWGSAQIALVARSANALWETFTSNQAQMIITESEFFAASYDEIAVYISLTVG